MLLQRKSTERGIFYEHEQAQGGTDQMRELNNIKIIAVDHGYGNIKTANTVTPTGITAYDTEPIFSGNILILPLWTGIVDQCRIIFHYRPG